MPAPCIQEPMIANITRTLERMEHTQEKMVTMVERIADQGARLTTMEDQVELMTVNYLALSERVRVLELSNASSAPGIKLQIRDSINDLSVQIDQILHKVSIMTSKPVLIAFCVVAALTLIGTVCDVLYHYHTVKEVLSIIR